MLLSLLVSVAVAQEPLDLSALLAAQGVQVGPKAEVRWLLAESGSARFPDDPAPGPTFAAGEMVEVVVIAGERTRVRKGDRYGWVPNAVLSIEAPAPAPAADNPLLGGMPPLLPAGSVPAPAPK